MMKTIFVLMMTFLFCLTSCTAFQQESSTAPQVEIAPNTALRLPSPAQLHLNVQARQVLTAHYLVSGKPNSMTSEVVLEANNNKLAMVAFSSLGNQIFSLDYDGNTIHKSSLPMPHMEMGIEHGLTDFIFTYASKDVIETMIASTGITFQDSPTQRLFFLNNQKFMEIDYENADPWKGKITLENFLFHYKIDIVTISVKMGIPAEDKTR